MDSVGDPNLSTVVGRPLLYNTTLLPAHPLEYGNLVLLQELAHETVVVPDRSGVAVALVNSLLPLLERARRYLRVPRAVGTSQ